MISAILGSAPVPVPPHVFALDRGRLRYAGFERTNGGVRLDDYRSVDLPEETFLPGQLGATLQESSALSRALDQILEGVAGSVDEASLVVPDPWARMSFAVTGELPRSAKARDEVLRWKLRRMVPYRVEDLRIRHLEVPALAGQEEPRRVLVVFLHDALFRQIEEVFAKRGVRLGHVSNETLSLLAGLGEAVSPLDLAGVLHRTADGYSLVFTRNGMPVIYRHKSLAVAGPVSDRALQIERDLRLTRKYVQEHVEGARLRRLLIAASPQEVEVWSHWLQEVFEVPVTPVASTATATTGAPSLEEVAPLQGAACRHR